MYGFVIRKQNTLLHEIDNVIYNYRHARRELLCSTLYTSYHYHTYAVCMHSINTFNNLCLLYQYMLLGNYTNKTTLGLFYYRLTLPIIFIILFNLQSDFKFHYNLTPPKVISFIILLNFFVLNSKHFNSFTAFYINTTGV